MWRRHRKEPYPEKHRRRPQLLPARHTDGPPIVLVLLACLSSKLRELTRAHSSAPTPQRRGRR